MPGNQPQMTDDEKEARRQDELSFLKSAAVTHLYVAAKGRRVAQFGEEGEAATISDYMVGLDTKDRHVGRLTSRAFANDAAVNAQLGRDPRKYGAALPMVLLDEADAAYKSAIPYVKVSDMLDLLKIQGVHEKRIPKDQRDMYMEDFAQANPSYHQALVEVYLRTTARAGVGNSLSASAKSDIGGLEKTLQSDPDAQEQ